MIILGIDPGTALTGWGVLKVGDDYSLEVVDYGCVQTKAGVLMSERLLSIYHEMRVIIAKHEPEEIAIERIFFNTNAKTAMSVGQARGVVMLAAAEKNVTVYEYTALQAKSLLTGYGRASKKDMQMEVAKFLKIKEKLKPDDVADALAMAIVHVNKVKKVLNL